MAKGSQVNIIERHIEKGMVALSFLFLLYSLFSWMLSSSKEVQMPSIAPMSAVPPAKLDSALLESAKRDKSMIDRVTAQVEVLPDYSGEIAKLRANPFSVSQCQMGDVAWARAAPTVPQVGAGAESNVTVAQLEKAAPAPGKPLVRAGRELPNRQPIQDIITAHVASVYPRGELVKAWNDLLKGAPLPSINVAVLAVEAQVQEKQPDGSWGSIRPVKTVRCPLVDSSNNPLTIPQIPEYGGSKDPNSKALVSAAISNLAQDTWQQAIAEPDYWDIWYPPQQRWVSWRWHLPKNEVSDTAVAAPEGSTPAMPPPTVTPYVPAPPGLGPRPGAPFPGMPPGMTWPGIGPPRPGMPYPGAPGTPVTPRPAAPSPGTPPAAGAAPVQGPDPVITPAPLWSDQVKMGKVLVNFHDNSLESAKTYRYRLRLILLNPLLTYDAELKNPEDGKKVSLATPYSDWSEPVVVHEALEFFVDGSSESTGNVRVRVAGYSLGQVVKGTFLVQEGQPIGGKQEVEVTNPADGRQIKQTVDFTTGAVAVKFDFNKMIQRLNAARKTVELLYLDERGQLRSRTQAEDQDSERYKQLFRESRPLAAKAAP